VVYCLGSTTWTNCSTSLFFCLPIWWLSCLLDLSWKWRVSTCTVRGDCLEHECSPFTITITNAAAPCHLSIHHCSTPLCVSQYCLCASQTEVDRRITWVPFLKIMILVSLQNWWFFKSREDHENLHYHQAVRWFQWGCTLHGQHLSLHKNNILLAGLSHLKERTELKGD
jgi:hypothetical protein